MWRQKDAVGMVAAVVVAVLLGLGTPSWAADADGDGVADAVDACPDTEIPEGVPTKALLPLHYALTDNDSTFNTFKGKESSFTTTATAGCSCTQIIALSGLGPLAHKFGCNQQVMEAFIAGVQVAPGDTGDSTGFPGDGVTGPPLAYQDNGDGTITDLNTGLMWEKKVAGGSSGCPTDSANLHGVDSTCTWAQATGAWIAAINASNLGGHSDWRVPNIRELASIVDYSRCASMAGGTAGRCVDLASIHPDFGPTAADCYWSSTAVVVDPTTAWFVDFRFGVVSSIHELDACGVRAVRGGL
jgi:hypothetical protein